MKNFPQNWDVSREWFNLDKTIFSLKVFFNKKYTKTLLSVKDFSDIHFGQLKVLWKKWVILDVDDCIAPHHGEITENNLKRILKLHDVWWKIVIFSNMKKTSRYQTLEENGIEVMTLPDAKPSKKWFEACLDTLQLDAKEVVMIWDNFLTDGGARNAGIDFIKVSPINTDTTKSFSRTTQKIMRKVADILAKWRWHI